MLSQRVVENFFKRAKFRRSRRVRTSVRASIKKEAKVSVSGEENKPGNSSEQAASQHSLKKEAMASKSTAPNGINIVPSSAVVSSCPTENSDTRSAEQCCSNSFCTNFSENRFPNELQSDQKSASQASHYVSSQSLSGPSLSNHQQSIIPPMLGQSSLSGPQLDEPQTNSSSRVVETLRTEVDRLKRELSHSQELLNKMQEREKQLRNRLSEQAQRQLQKRSSKFEDLSLGESRPTQLIKRYGNLYTESRLDAMDALEDIPNMADCEDLKVKLLLSVIVLAFRSAEKTFNDTRNKIRELLHIPRVVESGNSSFCHAAKDLEESIAIFLRKTVDRHDVSKNYKEVCERVWATLYDYPLLKECQGLLHYINDCVRIAWAMTVQKPPFIIDYESKVFHPDTHIRFHMSDAESPLIKSVLWPMLLEGEGGLCVSKGIVLT